MDMHIRFAVRCVILMTGQLLFGVWGLVGCGLGWV